MRRFTVVALALLVGLSLSSGCGKTEEGANVPPVGVPPPPPGGMEKPPVDRGSAKP